MNQSQEKIAEKIAKLLRLAESPNQHEAELAAQRASELMEKYQIAMADVLVDELQADGIVEERVHVDGHKRRWIYTLAHASAKLFDGSILCLSGRRGTTIIFVGTASDISAMKEVFNHLHKSWVGIMETDLIRSKAESEERGWRFTSRDTIRFKQGHGVAYSRALYSRAVDLARLRNAEVAAASSTGTSLVVLKDQALTEHMAKYGEGKPNRSSWGSALGQECGDRAGNSIALGGAIEG